MDYHYLHAAGTRADEAKAINLSLTTLAMCIEARAKRTPTHVPFRSSKLTRLLQVLHDRHTSPRSTCAAMKHLHALLFTCSSRGTCS